MNRGKSELKKTSLSSGKLNQGFLVHKSKLKLDALWDREETDFYRMFLYIKDNDRIKNLSSNIISPPRHLSLLFNSYFTRLKNKTELYNIITIVSESENSFLYNCHTRCSPGNWSPSFNNKSESNLSQGVFS